MNNLFKNVFRSFSNTKTALISLFFLMFFSLGIFAVLDNTASNLNNSYESLVQKGNLDDFVVNENYDYGNADFQAFDAGGAEITGSSSVAANDPVTMRLSAVAQQAALVHLALGVEPDKYGVYATGVPMSWSGYDAQTFPTTNDYVADRLRAAHNEFIALLESDEAISVKSKLKELNLDYREYESIEFTDSQSLIKVVKTDPGDRIDRLVLESGNPISPSIAPRFATYASIAQTFQAAQDATVLADPAALGLNAADVADLYGRLATNAASYPTIQAALRAAADAGGKIANPADQRTVYEMFAPGAEFSDQGFRFNVRWGALGNSVSIQDLSIFEAIVSPGNWKHLAQTKSVYGDLDVLAQKQSASLEEYQTWLSGLDAKYKIRIANTEFLIKGVGLTPDFMYPIFNVNSLVPNTQNEYLYFVNAPGYESVYGANLTSPVEKYLVGKFNSTDRQQQRATLDEINAWCDQNMAWPSPLKAAYFSDDASNYLNLNAARTSFVRTMVRTISAVSTMLIAVIVGLALFVSALVIKSYVSKNKFSLAVLQSNGYPKWKIILSLLPFSVIPAFVGGACGYVLGMSLQEVALRIFSGYWFIPVATTAFNFVAFAITLILPILLFVAVTLLIGWIALRKNVVQSLKNDSDYKISKFSLLMKKPFGKFGVITKFRAALAFNAFWKLVILSVLSAAIMVVFNFSWSVNGLFERSQANTQNTQHYQYAVDLSTPTRQSGMIKYQPIYSLGRTDEIPAADLGVHDSFYMANQSASVYNWGSKNPKAQKFGWDNVHVISTSDITSQQTNITYLENMVQSKITLDYDLLGMVNPWSLSATLMPINQLSASNDAFQRILGATFADPAFADQSARYINVSVDPQTRSEVFSINQKNAVNTNPAELLLAGIFKPEYLTFLDQEFERMEASGLLDGQGAQVHNYSVAYNVIGLDAATIGDPQTYRNGQSSPKFAYTRIDATDDASNELRIQGIKDWIPQDGAIPQDYLGPILRDESGQTINHRLFDPTDPNAPAPLVVNLYTAAKYGLSVGSLWTLNVNNLYDRITRKINGEPTSAKATFRIVGVCDSAKDHALFTSYAQANRILGFDAEETRRNLPFNGYYATDIDNLSVSLPLFSASGLYPGTNSFSPDNAIIQDVVKNTIDNRALSPRNYERLQIALGRQNQQLSAALATQYVQELNQIYANLPFNSMVNYVSSVGSSAQLFGTIASTTMVIQNVVLGIIVPIVLLIVVLISNMLIDELRKIGIRLKALGFTNGEILSSFFSIYVPVFIVGLVLAIPATLVLLGQYNALIMGASNIVLLAALSPIVGVLSFLALTGFFTLTLAINWVILRKLKLAEEMKSF